MLLWLKKKAMSNRNLNITDTTATVATIAIIASLMSITVDANILVALLQMNVQEMIPATVTYATMLIPRAREYQSFILARDLPESKPLADLE